MTNPSDTRPIPDPTLLTTEALNREIAALRDLLYGEIRHRGQLTDEQFRSVDVKFDAIEQRTAEQKTDTKEAVSAALAAAKDAVALQTQASERSQSKSEAAITKQIDAIYVILDRQSQAMNEKIEDLKTRLDRIEGKTQGTQLSMGLVFGAVGALAAIVTIVVVVANILTSQ
jgi:hypothetical protein